MSLVYDVVLMVGSSDNNRLEEFNAFMVSEGFQSGYNTPALVQVETDRLPGSKVFTGRVSAATWNWPDDQVPKLLFSLDLFDWNAPAQVVLLITKEQERTKVYRPGVPHERSNR